MSCASSIYAFLWFAFLCLVGVTNTHQSLWADRQDSPAAQHATEDNAAQKTLHPNNKAANITLQLTEHRGSLYITMPAQHVPRALFVWQRKLWIALPADVKIVGQTKNLRTLTSDTGTLLTLPLADDVFPAFLKEAPNTLVLGTGHEKRVLPTQFFDKAHFTQKSPTSITLPTGFKHCLTFRDPVTHQQGVILLTHTRHGFAHTCIQPQWRLQPTMEGLFLQIKHPNIHVSCESITSPDPLQKPHVPVYTQKDFADLWHKPHDTIDPLLFKAQKALLSDDTLTAFHFLDTFADTHATNQTNQHFKTLKAFQLTFSGYAAEALSVLNSCDARSTPLVCLYAVALMRYQKISQGIALLKNNLHTLRMYPDALKARLLLFGAQAALYTEDRTNAHVFMSLLDKMLLKNAQKITYDLLKKQFQNFESIAFQGPIFDKPLTWHHYQSQLHKKHRAIQSQLEEGLLTYAAAVERLKMLAQEGHDSMFELRILESLANVARRQGDVISALNAYQKIITHAPADYQALPKIKTSATQLYTQTLHNTSWPLLKRCALLCTYPIFLPHGARRKKMLQQFTPAFLELGLSAHLLPILLQALPDNTNTKGRLILNCLHQAILAGRPAFALSFLKKTNPPKALRALWQRHKAYALASMGQSEDALALLGSAPQTAAEARIMAPAYEALGKKRMGIAMWQIVLDKSDKQQEKAHALDKLASLMAQEDNLGHLQSLIDKHKLSPSPYVQTLLAYHRLADDAATHSVHTHLASLKDLRRCAQTFCTHIEDKRAT